MPSQPLALSLVLCLPQGGCPLSKWMNDCVNEQVLNNLSGLNFCLSVVKDDYLQTLINLI